MTAETPTPRTVDDIIVELAWLMDGFKDEWAGHKLIREAQDKLVELERALQDARMVEWIPVGERLPGRNELVLVCAKDVGTVHCLMQYSEPRWFIGQTDASYDWPITHWQPLPEPPALSLPKTRGEAEVSNNGDNAA